jgi:O-antigen/teichoic acid export membrane protein
MNNPISLKGSLLTFLVRLTGSICGLILTLVVTKFLTIEDAGRFFFSLAIVTVLGLLSSCGIGVALLRFVSSLHAENNLHCIKGLLIVGLKRVLCVSFSVLIIFLLTSGYFSSVVDEEQKTLTFLSLMILAVPFLALVQIISPVFQALNRPLISVSLLNISTQLICAFFLIIFYYLFSLTFNNVAVLYVVSAVITIIIAFFFLYFEKIHIHKSDLSGSSELIKSSNFLWVALFMNTTVQWSGQLIAGIYVDPSDLAGFSVSQRVSILMSFILLAINMMAAPKFSLYYKQKKFDELRNVSLFCSRLMMLIAIPIFIFIFVFAENLLSVFGGEYAESALILRVLIIGQFINLITGSVAFILNMTGHEKDMRNVVIISGSLSLALGFVMIPIFGVLGAAVSTAASLAVQNLIAVYMVKKRLGFNTLNILRQ